MTVQACIDRGKDKQVFVIATANSFRKLPESLTRAGRFDSVLPVRCPEGADAQVRQLLVENRHKLETLAQRIYEEKTLLGDQIQQRLKSA